MKIHGPVARAVGVAFNDFTAELAKQRAEAETSRDTDGGLSSEELEKLKAEWDCTDSPEFYDAWYRLEDGGTHYVIDIYPKPEVCYAPKTEIYGGGASYEIDAKTYEILKKELQE